MEGKKNDEGKPRIGLLMQDMSEAFFEISKVHTHGAVKYGSDNWKYVVDGLNRYTDAMYRHLNAEHRGELFDQDSEYLHAAHTAWNAIVRLQLVLKRLEDTYRSERTDDEKN